MLFLLEMVQHIHELTLLSNKYLDILVLLTGMEAPPNLGSLYANDFRVVFRDLADEYDVTLLPFLLEGVAGDVELNQADGIHPNTKGAQMIAEMVWLTLKPMLRMDSPR